VTYTTCPECAGTRLNEAARSSRIMGINLAEACAMQISDLAAWARSLHEPSVAPLLAALQHSLDSFVDIGLGDLEAIGIATAALGATPLIAPAMARPRSPNERLNIGMVGVAAESDFEALRTQAESLGEKLHLLGEIEPCPGQASHVVIEDGIIQRAFT